MIQSTGNNFGCPEIQFKDYQDENTVVLNSSFSFSPANEAYRAAEILEIYLPDLSILKSSPGFAYISTKYNYYSSDYRPCTVLKAWIRDKNTLCIERLPIYDDKEEITIWVFCLFAALGRRGMPIIFPKANIQYKPISTNFNPSDLLCVTHPRWCFLHFDQYSYFNVAKGTPITGELTGFPKDVDAEIPLVGGNLQRNDDMGVNSCIAHIKDGIINVEEPAFGMTSTGQTPFICAYFIRNGEAEE